MSRLFIAGFFAQSFARKLIDIDYHISMGGRAYATLAKHVTGTQPGVGQRVRRLARSSNHGRCTERVSETSYAIPTRTS